MGRCIVAGGKPDMKGPVSGILASDLAVGSVVKLMENGVATEYLVVNQGKPSGSSLYDDSCDGLWLLRKIVSTFHNWNSSDVNDYANSVAHTYLNNDFFSKFGEIEKNVIRSVKIPFVNGSGNSPVSSGTNGLSTKVFYLSAYEVGFTKSISHNYPIDGAKLDYFEVGQDSSSCTLRLAYFRSTSRTEDWWLRSANIVSEHYAWIVGNDGDIGGGYGEACTEENAVRPAIILPHNALFDKTTLILKGVA